MPLLELGGVYFMSKCDHLWQVFIYPGAQSFHLLHVAHETEVNQAMVFTILNQDRNKIPSRETRVQKSLIFGWTKLFLLLMTNTS
jgi:hypothetical protein